MLRKSIAQWATVAGLALVGAATVQAAEPIIIGQSAPLTGSNKELGEDIRDGALAYFHKVNADGGINGRKIELITLDDQNKTDLSKQNTAELLDKHNAVALFGYASTTLSKPAMPHVEKAKVPFVAPFTGADWMRTFRPLVFNHRAGYGDELEKVIEHYTTFGLKRFAVLHHDDTVGSENLAAVERALKARDLKAVSIASIKRTQKDIAQEVATVVKSNPEVVICTTLYRTTADFVKQSRKLGLNAQVVSLSFAGSTALAGALGEAGLGVVMSQVVPTPTKASVPIVREYHDAIKAIAPDKVHSFTGLESYIAAKILVEGVRRAGPNVTRASLLKGLESINNYDLGGYVVSFSPKDHNGSKYVGLTILGRDLAFKD
ncbi:MAG TPA: ABC transporter substrate-binding protein [Burkholderiales bacterium]|nr:ABC transporter substrate-binding protein [Burkholderiales bacterium]